MDAFDIAIGSVITQLYDLRWYRPVYYANQCLTTVERNYSTKCEALGLIYSVTKFLHYLLGCKFSFHVYHMALLYIADKSALTGKITSWALLLHEFTFDIVH